jgi:thymidylate kinase
VDYRRLNSVTKKDAHPLPRIDDILMNIGPAKWACSLDLYSGYMQLKMDDQQSQTGDRCNSIARTAFCVPGLSPSLYEMLVMPFGVTNGPAAFMRIILEVLGDLVGKCALVYLDDVLCYAQTFEGMLEALTLVFNAFRKANMKLNPAKCQFFRDHVTFLGYTISVPHLAPDPRLVEAVRNRKEPRNAKEVASFLGLCNWYRRFVPCYSHIAEPLTRLVGKNKPFVWGQEQQEAFNKLKERLVSYPVLLRPDLSKPFHLYTDASTKAVGAVLCQEGPDGREHPVAYHSRKLTATQRNYPATHLECLAVVEAVCEQFSDLVMGNPLIISTDSVSLKWLMTSQNLQGRLARWALRLQEYLPFTIQYRKGALNQAPDALSRDPVHDDTTPNTLEDTLLCHHQKLPEQLLTLQPVATSTSDGGQVVPEADSTSQGHPETPPIGPVTPVTTAPPVRAAANRRPCCLRISIDGNIGSGKSSVMEFLSRQTDTFWREWHLVPEPVHEWHNLLGPFYSAPPNTTARHSAAALLQMAVLNAYALSVPNPCAAPYVLMERSPWSSLAGFLPVQDLPPSMEQVVSQAAHHMHFTLDNGLPHAMVYLKAAPSKCLDRISARQRPGESQVTLEYLQQVHEQYEDEMSLFPGPIVTIDANRPLREVCLGAKAAVESLVRSGACRHPHRVSRRPEPVGSPFQVADFPLLRRLFPGQHMTTCDPFLLQLFPDQFLTREEMECDEDLHTTAPVPPTPDNAPTPDNLLVPTPQATTLAPLSQTDKHLPVEFKPHHFSPTPTRLLYDADIEAPVLFQSGPGAFGYSPQFHAEYLRRFGSEVDVNHRVNNIKALSVFADLGPWRSNGPSANIQIAVVPLKGLSAVKVVQVHSNGTEVVFIDTSAFAALRRTSLAAANPYFDECYLENASAFSWDNGLRNEGYTLDGWIRMVRMRPVLPCGLTLENPPPSILVHGSVPALPEEHEDNLLISPRPSGWPVVFRIMLKGCSCIQHQWQRAQSC